MPFFDVQQRVWWGNWYWHSVINMWLFFTDNFLFYCYYFKEIEKKDETKARAMRAFSPSFWFQKLLKYGRVCLNVAKLIFVKKRHKKTISGELHEGKKVYESWEIFIQHHTIYLKLKRVLFNEASSTPRPPPRHTHTHNGADEAVMKDLGWERKGPAMTGELVVLFLQPEQALEHAVIIRV